LAGILCGTIAYYLLGALGLLPHGAYAPLAAPELALHLPLPTLEFIPGLSLAMNYLPLAIPFALVTVVGGVDVTESAAAAGDDYNTRNILLVEGFATLVAGLCGGVIQSCPYIGHPAYKEMGGKSGYTIATALFIGLGGMLGYLSFFVDLLPEAAVAPILIFIGIEITAQAFEASPRRHYRAIAISFVPVISCLVAIQYGQILGGLGKSAVDLSGDLLATYNATTMLGNGFIITALLWGAAFAHMLDHRPGKSACYLAACGLLTLCGAIHSPLPSGAVFSPLTPPGPIVWHLAAGYGVMALLFALLELGRDKQKDT
jgi:AGZA family xanthine/uracil permease-like MFS transporter